MTSQRNRNPPRLTQRRGVCFLECAPLPFFMLSKICCAITTVQHHFLCPAGVKERQSTIRTLELHANFPAVVYEEDVLSVNVVEVSVSGVTSQHRPAIRAERAMEMDTATYLLSLLLSLSSFSTLSPRFMGQSFLAIREIACLNTFTLLAWLFKRHRNFVCEIVVAYLHRVSIRY